MTAMGCIDCATTVEGAFYFAAEAKAIVEPPVRICACPLHKA